ncbi:hypothetical protein HXX76_001418 [Chlamydomonas incerta]|uniref:Complex 1 LYR protein domain-containing protein n=1 Tax=Chlamydomonas incerta TaxID=51695 RepID=A0A835WC28_CHLIN|nr:hypothetical protein HXX76_001418 [Chlamydomonas incerta]|eukprot:KAG2444674.1 hypothetical protein HXX76_001418 [Chlamydomonas incerta]
MLRSRVLGLISQAVHKPNALSAVGVRFISEEQLGASADQVADLFERNLLKASRKKPDQPPRILTTRREAISLYREIWRYSALFLWHDERGRLFRDVIRTSARQEFEAARFEPDPEIINKLIITGRDCVQRTIEAFAARAKRLEAEGPPPPLRQ